MELIENKVYRYGYDNGKYGAEAKYALKAGGVLVLNLYGSNHWRDWLDDITFLRMKTVRNKLKCHRAWYYYAFRMYRFILHELMPENGIFSLEIVGHSMGGAVGAILQQMFTYKFIATKCTTYGSPRPFNCKVDTPKAYINSGDLVPFLPPWRPKCGTIYKSNKFIFPFWKAHFKYKMENWL